MNINGLATVDANGSATVILKNDSPRRGMVVNGISIRVPGDSEPGTCRVYYGGTGGDLIAISGNGRYDDAVGSFWLPPGGIIVAVWENQTPGLQAELWITGNPSDSGPFQGSLAFANAGGVGGGQWQPRLFVRGSVDPPFVSATFSMLQNNTDDRVFIARNWSGEFSIIGPAIELAIGLFDPTDLPAPTSPRAPLVHIKRPIIKERYTIGSEIVIPPGFTFGGAIFKSVNAVCDFWFLFNYQVEPYRENAQ